jgi:hypothetical protein
MNLITLFLLSVLLSILQINVLVNSGPPPDCRISKNTTKKTCNELKDLGCKVQWAGLGCGGLYDGGCQPAKNGPYCGYNCKRRCYAKPKTCWWNDRFQKCQIKPYYNGR